MKILSAKTLITATTLLLSTSVMASTQDSDKLLSSIKADIAAQRLAAPAGNNALERIQTFRNQAPYDFRVVPLVYEWGDAYIKLANKAIDAKEYAKAQSYLDQVWFAAALTPGLEEVQTKLDKLYKAPAGARTVAAAPSAADLERQRKAAQEAEKEKAQVEAERKRKAEEEKQKAAEEKRLAEQERVRRQAEERQRRAEAEEAEKAAAAQRLAAAQKSAVAAETAKAAKAAPVVAPVVAAPVAASVPKAAPATKQIARSSVRTSAAATAMWEEAVETSAPIANYPLPADQLSKRDRQITTSLEPICKAIKDNDASVVVHTTDKADYRWLTVRLTLCMRGLDESFRLRHSHQELASGAPHISLHPAREVSLVRQGND